MLAQEEARLLDHNFIGTEHVLLGLIQEEEGVAAQALAALGVSLDAVREKVAETVRPGSATGFPGSPPFTPRAKKVLELSLREALQLGHNYIGTEHLLLGLVREGQGVAAQVLVILGADLARVRQQVVQVLSGYPGGHLPAVRGERVQRSDVPFGPAVLVGWDDASVVLLGGVAVADAHTLRAEVDGVVYETCTYRPGPLPEISVSVAAAAVTREAFDDYSGRISDAEVIDGLGDAATYSTARNSLRVLSGSTLFVVQVRHHPRPRAAAMEAAQRALANMAGQPPAGGGESFPGS